MLQKKIFVIGTGGTAAGEGDFGKCTGYRSGNISVDKVISGRVRTAMELDIECLEVCRINSDDITSAIWLTLAGAVENAARRDDIAGIVVLHGTDTLEETAFFLHLALKTEKPVAITGAMRPPTALSADGDGNIAAALRVAAGENSAGRGVLVVFSDRIYSARYAVKTNTYSLDAINGGEYGVLGIIRDDEIYWRQNIEKEHTANTEFSVSSLKALPKVNVVYFHADADASMLEYALQISDGVVIAGAGAGEYSENFKNIVEASDKPVVISTRTNSGIIPDSSLLCEKTISAYDLPPSKAAVLLRLALTVTHKRDKLREIFSVY